MTNALPKISIIIPTYNRCQLLSRAIQSVLDQTYPNIELIVVDNCSTDTTRKMVQGLSNPRIKYRRLEKRVGISSARNIGIEMAEGQYIGFNDDDDEIDPQKTELQIKKFINTPERLGIVYCGHRYVVNNKVLGVRLPKYRGNIFRNLLASCRIHTNTVLIKKECFNKTGMFDPELPSSEDWDMWLRLSKFFDFDYVPDVLASYNLHDGSQISQNLRNKIVGRELFLKKHQKDLDKNHRALGYLCRHLGALYAMDRCRDKARRYFFRSIKYQPFNWRNYVYLVFFFLDKFKDGHIKRFASLQYGEKRVY